MLEACGIAGEEHECGGICNQAKLYNIEVINKNVVDNKDLDIISLLSRKSGQVGL